MAYGARLEIVLGVKTLAGSNPASSATYQVRTPATMIASDPAGIQTPDTSRRSCYPLGIHACTSCRRPTSVVLGATTSRAPLRTVAAAVKFAEPASQVARLAAALRDKRRSAGVG